MNILVSTAETQGRRESDFCFVPEGEPVMVGAACDKDRGDPDGGCGCLRSLVGFRSHTATTTVKTAVAEGMTREKYISEYLAAHLRTGFPEFRGTRLEAGMLFDAAQMYAEGTVLEYRNGRLAVRKDRGRLTET